MNRLPHISRPPRPSVGALRTAGALLWLAALCGCTNNPYPNADASRKVFYEYFVSPPRTLDPATAYSTTDHVVTGPIFDTLLEYHYLKRPYALIPGLAESLPSKERGAGGEVVYRFRLRPDLLYQDDDCFALSGAGQRTRTVTAADVAFEIERLADPAVNSPVVESFGKIRGFEAFSDTLRQRRADDASFSALRADRQYALAGGIPGVRVLGPLDLEIVLDQPYPQILYWFAMPFTSPVPWEAVAYYDGQDGRGILDDHPVGAGPFRLVRYERRNRIVLERNENWYGIRHPEWRAPGAVYPDQGEPADAAAGLLDADMVGRPLPFLERIEILRDPEPIPAFVKFLQGYYDISTIVRESFDRVVREGALSRKMAAKGMQLVKGVTPAVYYLGFNMDDPVVGKPAGARGRALRQAMSLAVDSEEFARLFMNGRGIPAQSPLPPGIFGYDPDYRNPYRRVDLERAAALLRRAGYPNGIDPETQAPLQLTFNTSDTSARAALQFQFFADAWRRIGLNVIIRATNYNEFQERVRRGAYQVFWWGWVADYPDPENFLFLLYGPMGRTRSGGPNTANFADQKYDELFRRMKARDNDAERKRLIGAMLAILERERPWIEVFYPEDYALHHSWLRNVKPTGLSIPSEKYYAVDPLERQRRREEWNRPVRWPAWVLLALLLAVLAPAVVRVLREER